MIAMKAASALALLLSSPHAHPGVIGLGVERAVAAHASAFVQVAFATRQPRTLAGVRMQVRLIRSRVLARLGNGFRVTSKWNAVLGMAGYVNAAGVRRLAIDPEVRRVDLDVGGGAADLQADPIIHADQARAAGYTGSGVTVAILDSGMQENHPDLADSLVAEQCYVAAPGTCPNGQHSQSGSGAARDDNGHGTNVAGIITGNGTRAPIGVAPAARVVIVRVLAADGSFSSTAQVVSGLQYILDHPALGVKVINMSLGTDALYGGSCDGVGSFATNFAQVVHSLRLQGVTVFASSGNQKSTTKMALPACLNEVVAVGAVYDSAYGSDQLFCTDASAADKVTCFSNSSTALDLLAPGAAITSTGRGSSTSTYYGTSQASPMAAAAAADLLQKNPSLTPPQITATLKSTGKLTIDSRNGRMTARIDILAALNGPPLTDDTEPPVVNARAARIQHGTRGKLQFRISDDSGRAFIAATVFRKNTKLRQWGPAAQSNGAYFLYWRSPARRQRLRFCVVAQDAAGNAARQSCATLKVT